MLIMNQLRRELTMSYVALQPRKRFYFRMSETERAQIDFIMQREGIPDVAKTIRYCIAEVAEQLQQQPGTPQKIKGA